MIVAKHFSLYNTRKLFKTSLNSPYDYSIYDVDMPFKMSKKNLSKYLMHENHKDLGVMLNNHITLDKTNNNALFSNKKAFAQSFQNKTILKLVQPSDIKYDKWMSIVKTCIHLINPSFLIIPINKDLNVKTYDIVNLAIQEINTVLFEFANDSFVVINQDNIPLSILAYIIHHAAFPSKVSLCLNLDFMINENYTLSDLSSDIFKFDILNKISIINTNKYTLNNKEFNEFLKQLPEDIIIYGEKI